MACKKGYIIAKGRDRWRTATYQGQALDNKCPTTQITFHYEAREDAFYFGDARSGSVPGERADEMGGEPGECDLELGSVGPSLKLIFFE